MFKANSFGSNCVPGLAHPTSMEVGNVPMDTTLTGSVGLKCET